MSSQFVVSAAGGVPAGSYNAKFAGLESYTENAVRFGVGVLLAFKIIGGDHDGECASRICSKKFSAKSNLYKFARALVGRDLETGESFDFGNHVGAKGMIYRRDTS
ncbi:MAG: hypothetical protein F9B45_29125 [Phycisphaera sp. RhM]|nr:hypothetical protein [Phycisphaera sp. RhM]